MRLVSHTGYLFLSLCLWVVSVSECLAFANNSESVEPATLKRISTAEGMTQGTINHIFQDSEGFVWLSTTEGLNVYNGYSVRAFEPESYFQSAYVEFVFQDADGYLWMSLSEQGLFRYHPQTEALEKLWDSTETYIRDVMTWHVDPDGETIWFFTTNAVLMYTFSSGKISEFLPEFPGFEDEQFLFTVQRINDYFWLGTNKGLYRYDPTNQSLLSFEIEDTRISGANSERSNRIRRLQHDQNGNLWVATARGLFLLNPEQLIANESSTEGPAKRQKIFSSSIIPSEGFFDLLLEENRILAATENGLVGIDLITRESETVLQFSNSNFNIFNNRIIRTFRDTNSNYWLASNARGAFVWDPESRAFKNYFNTRDKRFFSNNEIWDIEELEDNVLWLGTSDGLTRFDLDTQQSEFHLSTKEAKGYNSEVYYIGKDSFGKLWLSTSEGVSYFDPVTRKTLNIPLKDEAFRGLFESIASYVFVAKDDRIWISGEEGFYIYTPESGEVIELLNLKDAIDPYYSVGFFGELPQASIMLLSTSGQLWGVDTTTYQPFLIYEVPNFTPQELIYADNWLVDEQNRLLWLSFTTHGLVSLSLGDFSVVSHIKSRKEDDIDNAYGLLMDDNRRIWFSSHSGIYNYGLDNNHLMNFDQSNGISALEFNSGAWLKMKSGKLVYGSVNGITVFDPNKIAIGKDPHKKVVIDGITIANRENSETFTNLGQKEFVIDYDEKGINIHFSTLGMEQQSKVLYQYELHGIEQVVFPITDEPKARFSQLSPGKYEFLVRAFSPVTGYKTKPESIYLVVHYPPWKSPYAIGVYVLLTIVLLSLFISHRTRKRTALLHINNQLSNSEKRLRIALKSSQSEAWEWNNTDRKIVYVASSGSGPAEVSQSFREHLNRIHPDEKADFLREWQILFNSPSTDAFNFSYRYRKEDNTYQWYQNIGQILSRDKQGAPQQISGLLTDIHEMQSASERAMVFGEAFRNTKDWVLIINSEFDVITANHSFYKAFNLEPDSDIRLSDEIFRGLGDKMHAYRQIMERMNISEHWHGEDTLQLSELRAREVLVNISSIKPEERDEQFYVIIFTDVTQQKAAETELKKLSNYDALTELPNRTLLTDRIEHAMKIADRNDNCMALLFIDLDRFKQINDSLGHESGDQLLKTVSQRLVKVVRKQDTLARLGGDEFVVLLESFENLTQLGEVAREITRSISQPITFNERDVSVTPSIGVALYPNDADTTEELLRVADIAMYHAKKNPADSYHFFTETMGREVRNNLQIESDLRQALLNQEFVNFYQPIVDSETYEVLGAELLLRWFRSTGMVSPGEFIPVSEQIGLIIPMTNRAMRRGLQEVRKWREYNPEFYLSVNLSVIHFEQDGIVDDITSLMLELDLPASALKLEVTESALMKYPEKAIETMRKFEDLGIKLALDDFGTGYSSFAYLKQLPLEVVKLDRSFTWGIGKEQKDETIIDAILGVAANLGLKVIAEGVESEQHIDYLKQRHCDSLQGFYFSKPVAANDFLEYLQRSIQNNS